MERSSQSTGVLNWFAWMLGVWIGLSSGAVEAGNFRVATYNLENYLLTAADGRPMKSLEARAKIRAIIKQLDADILALQEVGGPEALEELRTGLAADGVRYDHWERVQGPDPHISVAVLSRFPILARRPHPREGFLLLGRRHLMSRGVLEIDLQPAPNYQLTLFSAHLKSRRPVPEANEAELREQEARILREKVDARLALDPKANIIVLGDFNDTKDSKSLRALFSRGNASLIDTRPAERGEEALAAGSEADGARRVAWTHYFEKDDTYSRVDYLLISRGLYHEWLREGTYVLRVPGWGIASDHRPLVAAFRTEDRGTFPASRRSAR